MKSLRQPLLLFAALTFVLSSCNSQEDSLVTLSPDSIAFSQEFKSFSNAENILFNFVATHEVDMAAMEKVAEDYAAVNGDELPSAEIFRAIPNAAELHQLMIDRNLVVKVVDQRFGYLSLSKADRKKVRDTYRAINPFILSTVETDEVLENQKKHWLLFELATVYLIVCRELVLFIHYLNTLIIIKKLILCGFFVFATISLQAVDCLRSFQIDMEGAYDRTSIALYDCQGNQITVGKCFREALTRLNHEVGTAANNYDDCMNRNGEPLP